MAKLIILTGTSGGLFYNRAALSTQISISRSLELFLDSGVGVFLPISSDFIWLTLGENQMRANRLSSQVYKGLRSAVRKLRLP